MRSGRPPKAPELKQGRSLRPVVGLVATEQSTEIVIPDPPPGLLRETKRKWEAFWSSQLASVVMDVDHSGLERWILNVDEWHRAMREIRRERTTKGSTGQLVMSPLAGYLQQREQAIRAAEEHYGMTPLARLRLGIAFGQAQLTARELSKALDGNDRAGAREEWESEWAEA